MFKKILLFTGVLAAKPVLHLDQFHGIGLGYANDFVGIALYGNMYYLHDLEKGEGYYHDHKLSLGADYYVPQKIRVPMFVGAGVSYRDMKNLRYLDFSARIGLRIPVGERLMLSASQLLEMRGVYHFSPYATRLRQRYVYDLSPKFGLAYVF